MSDVSRASPHQLVKRFPEAFRVRPGKYWSDMLVSAGVGWTLFAFSVALPLGAPLQIAATLGAIFALYRAMLFIHELAHVRTGQLPGFEAAWNLVAGIPLLVPSLMYVPSHLEHHKRTVFGTPDDPEYVPLAHWSRFRIARFVVTVAFVPLALVFRWALLGPLSRVLPPLRRLVVGKLSTLVINSEYTRPAPRTRAARRRWAYEEAGAAVYTWAVAGAVYAGWIPWLALVQLWIVGAGILVVNQVRTLVAHGYENETGRPMDSEAELLDSINLRGTSPLTVLFAPVGLRYHALHHAVPALPYHSLGRVHRRLLAELPRDASYHHTLRDGLLASLVALWNRAAPPPDGPPPPARLSETPAARGL